jgi:hypothetical protein
MLDFHDHESETAGTGVDSARRYFVTAGVIIMGA